MLRNCNKASIYDMDNRHIVDANVEIIDEKYVLLIFPEDIINRLQAKMIITFYDDDQGLVTCICEKSVKKNKGMNRMSFPYTAMFQIREQKAVVQRRSDVKVKVSIPIELRFIDDAENKKIAVFTKDISAGGVGFRCKEEIRVGAQFEFLFLEGDYPLELRAEVVWCRPDGSNDLNWRCGARFLDMTLAKEAVVRKFVFQRQLSRCER